MTAYVEIIFDNSDGRFLNQKDELILRRTIGQKKDEYSMDRKSATRHDVQQMLEGAGFSRSNPYYIVPQGRVTALTNMKDADRLNLLKEVAGTQVYEDRRQQSKRIMEDTEEKLLKIDDSLAFIRDRLQELEDEKKELKEYQEKDRDKRCLEYTIYTKDQEQVAQKLEQYRTAQEDAEDSTEQNSNTFAAGEQILSDLAQAIAEVEQRINVLELERAQHEEERKIAIKDKAKLELEVNSLTAGHADAALAEKQRGQELQSIQKQIGERQQLLTKIIPRYNTKRNAEVAVDRELNEFEARRQRLFTKQGRQAAYKNKRERDSWLQEQINDVNMALSSRKAVTAQTKEEIEEIESEVEALQGDIDGVRGRLENRGQETSSLSDMIRAATEERDQYLDKRKEYRREESKLASKAEYARQQLSVAEQTLSQMMDRATSQGLAGVRRIVREHKLEGVHGILAELFTPKDEKFKAAIEVSAGTSLFHFVVDTDATAQKLVDLLYKEKAGRITCVPLNRTKVRNTNVPRSNDAHPLLDQLEYDPTFEPAMKQVFGRTILCPSLTIASQYARTNGVEAMTLDGDRADRKGVLSGGYHDIRRSRMDAVRNVAKWRHEYDEATDRLEHINTECNKLDQLVTRSISDLQKAEHKQKQADDNHGPLLQELRAKTNEMQTKRDQVEEKRRTLGNIEDAVKRLNESNDAYHVELSSDFKTALTRAEEDELSSLSSSVQTLRKQLNELSAQRSDLEVQKTGIEVELRENLQLRLDQLLAEESELGGASQSGGRDTRRLQEAERSLQRVSQVLEDAVTQLARTNDSLDQLRANVAKSRQRHEEKQKAQIELSVTTRKDQKRIEKSASKFALYKVQEQEKASKIRNLGALPDAATRPEYKRLAYDVALKRFHKVKEDLKKYGHVNKKAVDQYNQFTSQRDKLESGRGELIDGQKSILELIETLDHRKDEAIERTFRQVSREFAKVFERLVPAGRGSLRIQRRIDQRGDEDSSDDEDERRARGVDSYTGVSIQVSFNSKHDEQQKIQQLSGGQKSEFLVFLPFNQKSPLLLSV